MFHTVIPAKNLLILVAATALVVGCGHRNLAADRDVLATVNGERILRSDIDKRLQSQVAAAQQKPDPAEEQALRLNILTQEIEIRLQLQRARKVGIAASTDETEAKLQQSSAPYTKEEFEKKLQKSGYTEAEYKEELRRTLTIDKLLNHEVASRVTISDAEIQDYYNQNKDQFNLTETRYNLAHIVVTNENGSSPIPGKAQNDAEARKKIEIVRNRLQAGEDFGSLAARYSEDDSTRQNAGELGLVAESDLKRTDNATRQAILKLKPGATSQPIAIVDPTTQRPSGYRIVRLISKEAPGQRELNDPEVQQFIRNQLRNQREKILTAAYDAFLHNGASIHNFYAETILNQFPQSK